MKKILSHIRRKSPETRLFFAIVCAAVLTAVVTGGYIAIEAVAPAEQPQSAPSPIGSLVDSIKGTVSDSNMSNQQTQVIDASQTQDQTQVDQSQASDQSNVPVAASTANDESNPFVNQDTTTSQPQQ